ncbi:hypothetical protein SLS58_002250 [Diplodia intermedia]|uniref:gamma-glutamylcyclotransferase n=1 Tax=Diplodia intermedia TaxID=856260 RepID=A0ABR3U0S3_9PEZI
MFALQPHAPPAAPPPPPSTLYFAYGSNLWLDQMHRRCPSSVYLGVGRLHGSNSSNTGWRWIINERGYANVVEVELSSSSSSSSSNTSTTITAAAAKKKDEEGEEEEEVHGNWEDDGREEEEEKEEEEEVVVYGTVYALPSASGDEALLDAAEGVPRVYGKEYHTVDFWPHATTTTTTTTTKAGEGDEKGSEGERAPASPASDLFVDVAKVAPRRVDGVLVYVDRRRTAEGEPLAEYVDRINEGVGDAVALGVPQSWVDAFVPEAEEN